jgi:hypothetical protein
MSDLLTLCAANCGIAQFIALDRRAASGLSEIPPKGYRVSLSVMAILQIFHGEAVPHSLFERAKPTAIHPHA